MLSGRAVAMAFLSMGLPSTWGKQTCGQYCDSADAGTGRIIGTAPFCKAECSGDCVPSSRLCTKAGKHDFSDHGKGCWSGRKVCCCTRTRRSWRSAHGTLDATAAGEEAAEHAVEPQASNQEVEGQSAAAADLETAAAQSHEFLGAEDVPQDAKP